VGRRDKLVIATNSAKRSVPAAPTASMAVPEYVQQACDASLKRLGLD
jgi:aryl-alcohol dehydrogenase-like predicted oxidoreductase